MTHSLDEIEDHDRGLSHDLPTLLNRRRALTMFSAVGLGALAAACSNGGSPESSTSSSAAASPGSSSPSASASASASAVTATEEIPEETAGPYPADGSNGVNVLTQSGIVRSDITSSFGGANGVATGVPLTFELTVLDVSGGTGQPLAGAALYLWHCTQDGQYSMYSRSIANENYLRGVQEADADGRVSFTSIFPGAYSGRWPHAHFEVYPSLASATSASSKLRTSQLALPEDVCQTVYATDGYSDSVRNLAQTSLDRDNVFSDGYSLQLATVDRGCRQRPHRDPARPGLRHPGARTGRPEGRPVHASASAAWVVLE